MRFTGGHSAKWRDADAYAPLLKADRSIFAWEWLRRNEQYRAESHLALSLDAAELSPALASRPSAQRWGLHTFERPCRPALTARPIWSADVHPYALAVRASPGESLADAFRLDRFGDRASIVAGADGSEHVLISDGLRTIRLDVIEGSVGGGPVTLDYQLSGRESALKPLLSLRRLLALCGTGEFPRTLYPQEARARRWLLLLRTHDALAAGADQREIAEQLLDPSAGAPRWRRDVPSLRSQVQRLVRGARAMAVGYRGLLS